MNICTLVGLCSVTTELTTYALTYVRRTYRSHRKFVRIDFYLGQAITRLKPELFPKQSLPCAATYDSSAHSSQLSVCSSLADSSAQLIPPSCLSAHLLLAPLLSSFLPAVCLLNENSSSNTRKGAPYGCVLKRCVPISSLSYSEARSVETSGMPMSL